MTGSLAPRHDRRPRLRAQDARSRPVRVRRARRGATTRRSPRTRRYDQLHRTETFWRDWLTAGERARPPVAPVHRTQRARPQGPQLRADRRDHGGGDDVASRDARAASATGTTATRGSATARSCCARCTVSGSTGRRSSTSRSSSTPRAAGRSTAGFDLQIMYGIGGERDLTEHTLDHLSGWRNSRPVRIGNGAYDQQQHDVWGMLLDSVAIHHARGRSDRPADVGGPRRPRRQGHRARARARSGHLGDAGRARSTSSRPR